LTGWINKDKCKKHMKLDIGSGNPSQGEVQPEGYVLNDIEHHANIDLVCDIKNLAQYIPKEFCSEVRASHILEHFGTKETVEVMKMIYRILEHGGEFEIFVPNFKWHAMLMATGNDEMGVHYAFGGQLDEYDYHKTGFSPKILYNRLTEAGFVNIKVEDGSSLHATCLKE